MTKKEFLEYIHKDTIFRAIDDSENNVLKIHWLYGAYYLYINEELKLVAVTKNYLWNRYGKVIQKMTKKGE